MKQLMDPTFVYLDVTVSCPAGKKALGGGAGFSNTRLAVQESVPSANGDGWVIQIGGVNNQTAGATTLVNAYAVCATVTS